MRRELVSGQETDVECSLSGKCISMRALDARNLHLNFGLYEHGPTAHVLFASMLKGPFKVRPGEAVGIS